MDGSLRLLNSSHVRERDKALLRSILVGGVWNGFLSGKVRGNLCLVVFCGEADEDGHLLGIARTLVQLRENFEFAELIQMDKRHWPRCLLWHGWRHLI